MTEFTHVAESIWDSATNVIIRNISISLIFSCISSKTDKKISQLVFYMKYGIYVPKAYKKVTVIK